MPGVLGELMQHLQLQRPDRAVASTGDDLIEGERSDRAAGHVAALAMGGWTDAIVSWSVSVKDRSGVVAMLISAYQRPLIAWSDQTPST